jgi:hypothetical protein
LRETFLRLRAGLRRRDADGVEAVTARGVGQRRFQRGRIGQKSRFA